MKNDSDLLDLLERVATRVGWKYSDYSFGNEMGVYLLTPRVRLWNPLLSSEDYLFLCQTLKLIIDYNDRCVRNKDNVVIGSWSSDDPYDERIAVLNGIINQTK
jgi:hypothetical protein